MKPFVHLHVHTEYSLLDGAAKISKLFAACKERNMPAIAITDHGNVYGAVRFVRALDKASKSDPDGFKVKPIIGCEFYVCQDLKVRSGRPDLGHLVLLAKNQEGYRNIARLNSIAFLDGFYYKPRIDYKTLAQHSEGLICLSGCLGGHIQENLMKGFYDEAKKLALELKAMFAPGDFYIEVQNHKMPEQLQILPDQIKLAKEIGVKTVATNDVHYVLRGEAEMQDVMMCVQTGKKVDDVDRMKMPNDEFYIKNYDEMLEGFAANEDALETTLEIAEKCNATIEFKLPLSPAFDTGSSMTQSDLLSKYVWQGAREKYNEITPVLKARIEYELGVFDKLGYSDYFLIVHDFINKCNELDIPTGPGRGSAAGSVVSYCLGITKVEPLRYDLLFERFLNPERVSPPDVDLDFCFDRRGEVIEYVTEKYGRDKVCQIITFGTMAAKAAIKDVARVLGVDPQEANRITKLMPELKAVGKDPLRKVFGVELDKENEKFIVPELKELFDTNPVINRVVRLAIRLEGMPRHTGVHAAGVVICREKLCDYMPLAKNGNDVTTQYDMRETEDIGMLKMDFLGLKTLTDLKGATNMIKRIHGVDIDFYAKNFTYDDHEVFKIIADGNTDAIFQLESGGMTRIMKELKPDTLEDLIAGIALYRPGPMASIPKFIENKHNPEAIVYEHPKLTQILTPTYGVIVYQEQVMRIFQELAGYSLAQADWVRKIMGKKLPEELDKEHAKFIDGDESLNITGCIKNGVDKAVAEDLFAKMKKFGEYGFNKSHSAVYAYIAYQTAYLKKYYEVEFCASVLNNRIDKIEELTRYLLYAKRENIQVLPPSINKSGAFFEPEGKRGIRFGLAALKNVGMAVVEELLKARERVGGRFNDIVHLIENLEGNCLNKRFIESLILSGALDEFGVERSRLIAVFPDVIESTSQRRKNKESGQGSFFDAIDEELKADGVAYPSIPEYRTPIKLKKEKEVVGTYISGHPLDAHLARFNAFNLTGSMLKPIEDESAGEEEDDAQPTDKNYNENLENNMAVTCGGIVTMLKKVMTKKSAQEMAFLTIEDLEGSIELMLFPKIWEKYKGRLDIDSLVTAYGKLSIRGDEVPVVLVDKFLFWEEADKKEEEQEKPAEEKKTKILYLKYSTLDYMLAGKLANILRSHIGESSIKVRCTETGGAFAFGQKVDVNDVLLMELKGLLGAANVEVTEKNNK